jgi:TetR/AcrR family transcriptional repressor of nem operon
MRQTRLNMKTFDTYRQIVKTAESLAQTRGYNGFSFNDIAKIIGIKTASIHYYFPTKADLAKAVIIQHADMICGVLDQIINNPKLSHRKILELFVDSVFAVTYRDNQKMCLGGMLGADVLTLPETVRKELHIFFDRIQGWLKTVLKKACETGKFSLNPKEIDNEIKIIFTMIEGSILLARVFHDEKYLRLAKKNIVARLIAK